LFLLAIPLASSTRQDAQNDAPRFSGVAFAGRTILSGAYCECGTQDCICDPGEVPPGSQSSHVGSSNSSDGDLIGQQPGADIDSMPGALLAGLLFILLWLKMR
jgi:hypothetical protein